MATVRKILGQSTPANTNNTVLYTAPAATEAYGNLTICNRGDKEAKVNVAQTVVGGTLGNKDYLIFEMPIKPRETKVIENISLGGEDFITIKTSKTTVSFNFSGTETA